jgi:cadherin EGF LAG seven-pass G-type receptor 1
MYINYIHKLLFKLHIFYFEYRLNGEWTRAGCHTELPEDDWWKKDPIYINCTCNQLSTYAVLTDVVDEHVIYFPYSINNFLFNIKFN